MSSKSDQASQEVQQAMISQKSIAVPKPETVEEIDEDNGDLFLEGSDEFIDLKLEDFTWKIKARKTYGWILVVLLFAQNIVVFSLVIGALLFDKMQDLQIVFGVLVTATLGETAYMVKVIIEWLFKDINYPS